LVARSLRSASVSPRTAAISKRPSSNHDNSDTHPSGSGTVIPGPVSGLRAIGSGAEGESGSAMATRLRARLRDGYRDSYPLGIGWPRSGADSAMWFFPGESLRVVSTTGPGVRRTSDVLTDVNYRLYCTCHIHKYAPDRRSVRSPLVNSVAFRCHATPWVPYCRPFSAAKLAELSITEVACASTGICGRALLSSTDSPKGR
jgi:hypothetical protein